MKASKYIIVDVSDLCKFCGYPIDPNTSHCTHCSISETQTELDNIIAEKALWSDDCFTNNFHKDFMYTPKYEKLPYSKFQQIECRQFHQYEHIFGVCYSDYNNITNKSRSYYGYVDNYSRIVIPIIYEDLGKLDGTGIIPAKLNNKYGMINIHNQVIVPFEYDYLEVFHDGLAQYKQGGQRGYINIKGQKVINLPSSCDETYDFQGGQARVGMWIDGERLYGVIDQTGEFIIPPVYHSISTKTDDECYRVCKKLTNDFSIDKRGFQICYRKHETIALPLDKYYYYGSACGNLIEVARYKKATSYNEQDKLLWGVITNTYKEIVPLEYNHSQIELIEGDYALIKQPDILSKKYYYTSAIGLNGKTISLPGRCIKVEYLANHQAFKIKTESFSIQNITLYEEKYGTSRTIASLHCDSRIMCFMEKYAYFSQNRLKGILSLETGKIILPPQFNNIFYLNGLIYVKKDTQYGAFSSDSFSYIPYTEQDWENMYQRYRSAPHYNWWIGSRLQKDWEEIGLEKFEYNNKVGVISSNSMKIIIPPHYDHIALCIGQNNRQLFICTQVYRDSYGLMDSNGVLLTPCKHDNDIDDWWWDIPF